MKHKVAVYGTLRKNFGNHRVMQMARGTLIGEATIQGATMFSYGPYPVIDVGTEDSIFVEVYEVEDLAPLDRLESYPSYYDRSLINTPFGQAFIYHIPSRDRDQLARLRKVESGIWK